MAMRQGPLPCVSHRDLGTVEHTRAPFSLACRQRDKLDVRINDVGCSDLDCIPAMVSEWVH